MSSTLYPARTPGADGLLVFVMLDMLFFGLMLTAFCVGRVGQAELYAVSRQSLDVDLGMVNTMILLASSWAVAVAVRATALGRTRLRTLGLLLGIALGLAFLAVKSHEYRSKINVGITPLTSEFFTWYYAITGLHMLHVVAGVVALVVAWRVTAAPRTTESIGLFWHMVDLLWVMLFPIVYLL